MRPTDEEGAETCRVVRKERARVAPANHLEVGGGGELDTSSRESSMAVRYRGVLQEVIRRARKAPAPVSFAMRDGAVIEIDLWPADIAGTRG